MPCKFFSEEEPYRVGESLDDTGTFSKMFLIVRHLTLHLHGIAAKQMEGCQDCDQFP